MILSKSTERSTGSIPPGYASALGLEDHLKLTGTSIRAASENADRARSISMEGK